MAMSRVGLAHHPSQASSVLHCLPFFDLFSLNSSQTVMRRLGLRQRQTGAKNREALQLSEWWLSELAQQLEMPEITLYNWVKRGWVKARKQDNPPHCWIIWANETEIERLKQLRQRPAGYATRQRWLKQSASDLPPCPD